MAFKSKRLEESKNSYENALSLAYSKEAWLGLAITKLHLLSEDQTEVDVHYALDKTIELYPKSKNEVINELIENSKYLIHKYSKLAVQLGFEAKKQEDAKNMAAVASVASAVMGGLSSTSKWSNRFSLATGVIAPVLPTLATISRTSVVSCCDFSFPAIAHRGDRLRSPNIL